MTLLERLGLDDPKALLNLPMADILGAIDEAPRLNFIPVAGGPHLPEHPFDPDAAPSSIGVPLLIGSNRDEMTLFTLGDPLRGAMTREQVAERLQDSLGDYAEQVIEAYEASRPEASPWEIYIAIISDGRFRQPSLVQVERLMQHSEAPVYVYEFWYESDYAGIGAAHAVEIPFVFAQGDRIPMTGTGPGRYAMAGAMSDAWVAFARYRDPNHAGLPPWPRYDLERRPTMIFDVPSWLADDPRTAEREAWQGAPLMR